MGCAASREQISDLLFPDYLKQAGLDSSAAPGAADAGKRRQSALDKLGGKEAVDRTLKSFNDRIQADRRINQFFAGASPDVQHTKQASFLLYSFGSPDHSKASMYEAFKDLDLKEEHFAAIQEHFTATLHEVKLPMPIINEALVMLAGVKRQVLGLEDGAGKPVVKANSVYARMGGQEAIESAVEIFYNKALSDTSISGFFAGMDMATQRAKMAGFLSFAFGGPSAYTGRDLYAAHQGLGITEAQFNAFTGHMVSTLRVMRVPKDIISDVLDTIDSAKAKVLGQEDSEGRCIQTLYDRMGGADAVEAVVELFYPKVLADPSISPFFESMDMQAQQRKLVSFMTYVLGGPGQYTGRALMEAHQHLNISGPQFDSLVGHFSATMKLLRVPKDAAEEALTIINAAKPEVVSV